MIRGAKRSHVYSEYIEFEAMVKHRRQGVYEHIAWERDVKVLRV